MIFRIQLFDTPDRLLCGYRPSDQPVFDDYDMFLNFTSTYAVPSSERTPKLVEVLCKTPKLVVTLVGESKETGAPLKFSNPSIRLPHSVDGTRIIAVAKDWWGKG